MTVSEWRKRHRKCKFCAHCAYPMPNYLGDNALCRAKKKLVNDEILRIFCRAFKLKEDEE